MTSHARKTILVVEDDTGLRRLLGAMLTRHGFAALEASSAEAALPLFDLHRSEIDLAIIDMLLPGVSGLDFAAELERRQPGLKILYISGYVDSIAVEAIARRSLELLLLKPFTEDRLIERVVYLLGLPAPPAATGKATWASRFPWDRLMEASDLLGPGAAKLLRYKNSAAGYGIAAAHTAALRAVGVPYSLRPGEDSEHPVELWVSPGDLGRAREMIGWVGIGADTDPAE